MRNRLIFRWPFRGSLVVRYGAAVMAIVGILGLFLISKPAAQDKVTKVTAGTHL